ncbi:MAG: GFA family protein [Paracoccaceae bacterium]
MNPAKETHDGGCLCGSVRYRLNGSPDWSAHCHCRSCQRAVGAAFTTWVGVKSGAFEVTEGQFAICETSPGVERGFCSACGTSLTYVSEEGWPGQISVLAPTLDDPAIAKPTAHVYVAHRQPWVKLDDGLPGFEEF